MRLVAIMPDREQVGFLVDSLRQAGFERDDMIITDLAGPRQETAVPNEVVEEMIFIESEREGLWEAQDFFSGVSDDTYNFGVAVAVEVPKHAADRVRRIMEENGAVKIYSD